MTRWGLFLYAVDFKGLGASVSGRQDKERRETLHNTGGARRTDNNTGDAYLSLTAHLISPALLCSAPLPQCPVENCRGRDGMGEERSVYREM